MSDSILLTIHPSTLAEARSQAHKALQMLSRGALQNLFFVPDYSHGSLTWDRAHGAFLTQPIPTRSGALQLALSVADLSLILVRSGEREAAYPLQGISGRDACGWLDKRLKESGLQPVTGTELPYELLPEVEGVVCYESSSLSSELAALCRWFDLAEGALDRFTGSIAGIYPGPSPVRCWPHHFDIATFVGLEEGDPETARGIGVGLSPGDESYDQPYFYISPYPSPDPATLPDAPAPGRWNTTGFVGAVATATDLIAMPDPVEAAAEFVGASFALAKSILET